MDILASHNYRSHVLLGDGFVKKIFSCESSLRNELYFYNLFPTFSPEVFEVKPRVLIMERLLTVSDFGKDGISRESVYEMLLNISEAGVHHRDAHILNIAIDKTNNPKLLDWETAIEYKSPFSYDLFGPDISGVPIPPIYQEYGFLPEWWGAGLDFSLGKWFEDI